MRHIDFTSLGFGSAAIEGLTGSAPASLPAKCRAFATYTLQRLEQAVSGRGSGKRFAPTAPVEPWIHIEHLPR